LREVQSEKPNPQPLPYKGRGVRVKASLLLGERFGEVRVYHIQSRRAIKTIAIKIIANS
jgi:hypothetical protein